MECLTAAGMLVSLTDLVAKQKGTKLIWQLCFGIGCIGGGHRGHGICMYVVPWRVSQTRIGDTTRANRYCDPQRWLIGCFNARNAGLEVFRYGPPGAVFVDHAKQGSVNAECSSVVCWTPCRELGRYESAP